MDHLSAVLNNKHWQVRGINPLAVKFILTKLVRLQTQTDTKGCDPLCWCWSLELNAKLTINYRTVCWGKLMASEKISSTFN